MSRPAWRLGFRDLTDDEIDALDAAIRDYLSAYIEQEPQRPPRNARLAGGAHRIVVELDALAGGRRTTGPPLPPGRPGPAIDDVIAALRVELATHPDRAGRAVVIERIDALLGMLAGVQAVADRQHATLRALRAEIKLAEGS